MKEKQFIIPDDQLKELATGYGECVIPDTVLVLGRPIRKLYRVMPERYQDSGWRFFCGDETPEYLARPGYTGVYDVNVAANYSPEIIEFLDSPPYSAYEYSESREKWVDTSLITNWQELK